MKLWILDETSNNLRGSYTIHGVYNSLSLLKRDNASLENSSYAPYEEWIDEEWIDEEWIDEFDFQHDEQLFAMLEIENYGYGSTCWEIKKISNRCCHNHNDGQRQVSIKINTIDRQYEELP